MSTLAYFVIITGRKESPSSPLLLFLSLSSSSTALTFTSIFSSFASKTCDDQKCSSEAKDSDSKNKIGMPKKSQKDGASANPIENYLLVFHPHYPSVRQRIIGLE
jgi:hypothetical protein